MVWLCLKYSYQLIGLIIIIKRLITNFHQIHVATAINAKQCVLNYELHLACTHTTL